MFISKDTNQWVVGHVENVWLTVTWTDMNKMVWKAQTYSKLGEYIPHLNYHHRNGGREVRLVQSVTASGRSKRSSQRTCNGGTGWQLVYHTNALSCLASLQVAPSAINQICQTPPWTPATSILYYGLNDWHWCCIKCGCLLRYVTGLVVPATSMDQNVFRSSGTTNTITKPHKLTTQSSDTPLCELQIPQIFSSLFIWLSQPQDYGVDMGLLSHAV